MITHTSTGYLPKGINVRTYQADTFSEAFEFAQKFNGQVRRIFNGTKNTFKVMI